MRFVANLLGHRFQLIEHRGDDFRDDVAERPYLLHHLQGDLGLIDGPDELFGAVLDLAWIFQRLLGILDDIVDIADVTAQFLHMRLCGVKIGGKIAQFLSRSHTGNFAPLIIYSSQHSLDYRCLASRISQSLHDNI